MILHDDAQKAIHAVPLPLRRFYVQAYQSFLFNHALSASFADGENLFEAQEGDVCYDSHGIIGKYVKGLDQYLALPFVGYSYYKKTRFDFQISKILQTEEITPKDFFIKEMQEISSEGGFRQAAIQCTDYSSKDTTVEFTLSRGSFATIVLREIMKPEDPLVAGF
jgi:tRNA pseudouridine13 synthase